MQTSQLPETTTAYPWATLIITISINLACQVSPLEDTLVSTKRTTCHCKLWDTARDLHFTPPWLKSSTNQTVCQNCHITICHIPKWRSSFWMILPSSGLWYSGYFEKNVLVWTSRRWQLTQNEYSLKKVAEVFTADMNEDGFKSVLKQCSDARVYIQRATGCWSLLSILDATEYPNNVLQRKRCGTKIHNSLPSHWKKSAEGNTIGVKSLEWLWKLQIFSENLLFLLVSELSEHTQRNSSDMTVSHCSSLTCALVTWNAQNPHFLQWNHVRMGSIQCQSDYRGQ